VERWEEDTRLPVLVDGTARGGEGEGVPEIDVAGITVSGDKPVAKDKGF